MQILDEVVGGSLFARVGAFLWEHKRIEIVAYRGPFKNGVAF